jgi:hypothetical protein
MLKRAGARSEEFAETSEELERKGEREEESEEGSVAFEAAKEDEVGRA